MLTLQGSKRGIHSGSDLLKQTYCYGTLCRKLRASRLGIGKGSKRVDMCDYCANFDTDRKRLRLHLGDACPPLPASRKKSRLHPDSAGSPSPAAPVHAAPASSTDPPVVPDPHLPRSVPPGSAPPFPDNFSALDPCFWEAWQRQVASTQAFNATGFIPEASPAFLQGATDYVKNRAEAASGEIKDACSRFCEVMEGSQGWISKIQGLSAHWQLRDQQQHMAPVVASLTLAAESFEPPAPPPCVPSSPFSKRSRSAFHARCGIW